MPENEDKTIRGTIEKGFKSATRALFGSGTQKETKVIAPSSLEAGETETKVASFTGIVDESLR